MEVNSSRRFTNTIFYLVGFAGVGKYTVAKELSMLTEARIVDNHYVNNPIFGLIEQDGVTPLPRTVWYRVNQVRAAVFETVTTLSPQSWNFVLTQELIDEPLGISVYYQIVDMAKQRGSLFVPVRLVCETEELCRRVAAPKRRERMKSVDVEEAHYKNTHLNVFDPSHPHTLTLDVTSVSPAETARQILLHARSTVLEPETTI